VRVKIAGMRIATEVEREEGVLMDDVEKAALERSECALPEAVTHGPASCQNEHR
jgi:hypothetical protein